MFILESDASGLVDVVDHLVGHLLAESKPNAEHKFQKHPDQGAFRWWLLTELLTNLFGDLKRTGAREATSKRSRLRLEIAPST